MDAELLSKLKAIEAQPSPYTFREDVIAVCKDPLNARLAFSEEETHVILDRCSIHEEKDKDCLNSDACRLYQALPDSVKTYVDLLSKLTVAQGSLSETIQSDWEPSGTAEDEADFQVDALVIVRCMTTVIGVVAYVQYLRDRVNNDGLTVHSHVPSPTLRDLHQSSVRCKVDKGLTPILRDYLWTNLPRTEESPLEPPNLRSIVESALAYLEKNGGKKDDMVDMYGVPRSPELDACLDFIVEIHAWITKAEILITKENGVLGKSS